MSVKKRESELLQLQGGSYMPAPPTALPHSSSRVKPGSRPGSADSATGSVLLMNSAVGGVGYHFSQPHYFAAKSKHQVA
jgi:hypothetical protein